MASRFRLDTTDGKNAWKVLLYSVLSSVIASLIIWLSKVDFPPQYLGYIPVVNVLLVVFKDFLEERK